MEGRAPQGQGHGPLHGDVEQDPAALGALAHALQHRLEIGRLDLLAPLASGDPDGLEWVAGEHGFIDTAQDALYSIIPDYAVPGVDDPVLSTILAGLIGVVIVFLLMIGLGYLLRRRRAA